MQLTTVELLLYSKLAANSGETTAAALGSRELPLFHVQDS
jgi:hypothetical protein